MLNSTKEELEGITLEVYLCVISKRKSVGPREVMKGAHLSSPSVAYRHLQKLEDLGYLKKNRYGEYLLKNKAVIRGFIWIRKHLISKMLIYSMIFLGVLIAEFIVLLIHYSVEDYTFKVFFTLLIIITGFSMSVFGVEGLLQQKRLTQSIQK
jgi:hypothetical protein